MKKLFGLFVIGILSSTAMAELVCLAPSGCAIEIETGACPTCVETLIVESSVNSKVESIVVKQSSKDPYDVTPSECPNYFEKNLGGKTCEQQMHFCIRDLTKIGTEWLCPGSFQNCKNIEDHYNETWERNHGKITCG